MHLRLHDYYRSSASYRVRIALNLKGVAYESVPIDLLAGGPRAPAFLELNSQGFVPMLEAGELRLTQSLAIIAWLDATWPDPPLLPADPAAAAQVRALALIIACDIHPLNNLRVLKKLTALGLDQDARDGWYRQWIADGFAAMELLAAPRAGRFVFGDTPTLADICLVPQMFNARRFDVPLEDYPTLVRTDAEATALPAFAAAHPERVAGAAASG